MTPRHEPEPEQHPGAAGASPAGAAEQPAPDAVVPDAATPGAAPPDAAEGLAIIAAQQAAVRDRAEPDARLLFGVWGLAWVVGYSCLYLTALASPVTRPAGWAFAVGGGLLAAAVVVTLVHIARRMSGVSGTSATTGAMYGWSWTLGIVAVWMIMVALIRAGAPPEVIALGWNSLPCLVVGMMYLSGGVLWRSTVMYTLGVWVLLVGGAAALAGVPYVYLVMATAGGGGLLAGGLATHFVYYRGRT